MSILKVECPDCHGEGSVECENCEGSGECYCSRCESDHDCGWCDGEGTRDCETCKGSGLVIWNGEPLPSAVIPEEAVCSCGRPAAAFVGKREVCSLCEAAWVVRSVGVSSMSRSINSGRFCYSDLRYSDLRDSDLSNAKGLLDPATYLAENGSTSDTWADDASSAFAAADAMLEEREGE